MTVKFTTSLVLATMLTPLSALAQSPPPDTESAAKPDVVVVTAQRREEELTDVPISITAVSSAQLERAGIADSLSLSQVTPGLQFASSGAYAQPTIRGIGTSVTSAGSDANVAVYVDGVYMPNQNGNVFDFADVKQIDVLKGPQGTLYGRNATGGAINVTTLAPSFDPHANITLGYGSFNGQTVNLYGTTPIISDKLAGSLSFLHSQDDGYSKDVLRGTDMSYYRSNAVRGKLLWRPTDKLDITLAADAGDQKNLRGYSLKVLGGNVATANAFIPDDERDLALSFNPNDSVKGEGASLTVGYDLGWAKLSNITAYRVTDVDIFTDLDRNANANSATGFSVFQHTFTEEVNLTSTLPGPFQWVAGIYYYDDTAESKNLVTNGVKSLNFATIDGEAKAAYFQADYAVTPKLTLTAGIRYSTETRTLNANRPTGAITTIFDTHSWDATTPRVAVRYGLDDYSNIYGSWGKGFKSGAYNGTAFSTVPVNPESVSAYEVGYKRSNGGADFSVAAYYYDYTDIQVQAVTPGTGLTTLTNAAQAEIYGAEAQYSGRITDNLRFDLGFAYTHAIYNSFPAALVTVPKTTAAECGANPNRPCGNNQLGQDASGKRMIRTPEFTANLGVSYQREFAGGDMEIAVNEYYNDGFYWNANNRLSQPSYQTLNASISWSPANGPWRFTVWGKNLTDTVYEYYVTDTTAGDAASYAAPRSIGAKVNLKF